MLIVGLTGSIGMGKSTVAQWFRDRGIAVFDADKAVHDLYRGEAAPLIEAVFPGTVAGGEVNRQALSAVLIERGDAGFRELEAIVHPLVRQAEKSFLDAEAARGAPVAVLEIPLLLETGAERLVDCVVVVSAGPELQAERVLARPGMTPDKLAAILARQMPDAEKRARADFVVDTACDLSQTEQQVDSLVANLRAMDGGAYQRHWR